MAGKGAGQGKCCCGGCWSPPTDPRAATTADPVEVQAFCCRCIPRFLCWSIGDAYGTSYTLLSRDCSSTGEDGQPYTGGPIQFRGNMTVNGDLRTIVVRLEVDSYGVCSIVWSIAETGDSGSREIDHADVYDGVAAACYNFGGTWELYDGSTLTLEPPEGFDISSHIACGGCSCICKCLCISVLSQAPDGTVTIVGTNEVVCGVVETASVSNCAGTRTAQVSSGSWTTYEGWQVILPGGAEGPPESCTVSTGTEVSYAPCTLPAILYFADEEIHIINAASGDVVAVYQWNIEDRTPIRVSWVGYVLGEAATAYFQAYNWSTTAWDALGSQAGQAAAGWKFQRYQLGADYVGTGVNEGIVKIRVSAENATSLSTDMLRLQTTRCCKLELLPPVEPAETLTKCDLSDPSNCPTVFHAWQFEDVDGVLWYVSIDCAWCGSQCGSVFTACCDRPVPRTLFAEVTVDCPSCITTFVVPLLANEAGSIWDGSGLMCTEPFSLSLSCDGTTWHIQTTAGPGACSFSGDATTAECEPLYLVFSGFYAGGIGCCGFGSMDTMVAITIVVFE